jgi:hypothetical protein
MKTAGNLEYALSRMQARLSRRPTEGTWAAIEEARAIAPILDAARETSLGPLVKALPPVPDLHDVDAAARAAWTRTVEQAAAWMPSEWHAAIAWCDGREAPVPGPATHPTLLPSLGHPEWRRRWPPGSGNGASLEALAQLFTLHLARFRRAAPHEATALKRDFEARLATILRRHPMEPVAAFAWLGIAALDLERLRGELERRIAFPGAKLAA